VTQTATSDGSNDASHPWSLPSDADCGVTALFHEPCTNANILC